MKPVLISQEHNFLLQIDLQSSDLISKNILLVWYVTMKSLPVHTSDDLVSSFVDTIQVSIMRVSCFLIPVRYGHLMDNFVFHIILLYIL